MTNLQAIEHNDIVYINRDSIVKQIKDARLAVYLHARGRELTEQEKGIAFGLALIESTFMEDNEIG